MRGSDSVGIDLFDPHSKFEFLFAGEATFPARLCFLLFVLTSLFHPTFFFRIERVRFVEPWRRLSTEFLLQLLDSPLEALELSLLHRNQLDQSSPIDRSIAKIPLQLFNIHPPLILDPQRSRSASFTKLTPTVGKRTLARDCKSQPVNNIENPALTGCILSN